MSATAARTRTTIPVFSLANGHALELDVHELVGRSEGPVLGITAGIHGDEPVGIETVRRVLEAIDPDELSGTVLALPVCNPYALAALTRNTPIDMSNLNRVFPGDPDGMLTEQLAHAIITGFLPRCEYLFDLHSGGNLPCVDYVYLHTPGQELGRAFGAELMLRSDTYVGSLGYEAAKRGIPVVVTEYGGGGALSEHYVEKGVRGILNAMRQLDMLEGDPEPAPKQRIVTEMRTLRPHHGGLLVSEVRPDQLGQSVAGGSLLGTVRHPSTFEVLERIEAPFDPSILVLVRDSVTRVEPGDYGFMVANGATAEDA
jgi:predicted deacylase